MPRQILKNLGLSDNETKIYLTTLSLGQAAASTIAKKCGIKRTTTYSVIDNLIKKAFLTTFTRHSIQYYAALDPYVLVDRCSQKVVEAQRTLHEMNRCLPILDGLKEKHRNSAKTYYFEGLKPVLESYIQFIHNVPDNGTLYNFVSPAPAEFTEFRQGMRKFISLRKEKKIYSKSICILSDDGIRLKMADKYENRETRLIQGIETNRFSSELLVSDTRILQMSYLKDCLFSNIIENDDIASMQIMLFEIAWNDSKKQDEAISQDPKVLKRIQELKSVQAY